MKTDSLPNKNWPINSHVLFCDAYGFNPVKGKVTRHYGDTNILVEDAKGVVYFGATWRVMQTLKSPVSEEMFDELLGGDEPAPIKNSTFDFEDLLG